MSLSLKMSPNALSSVRNISRAAVRRGVRKVIAEIQENPVGRSTGFSFGLRYCDGYFQVGKVGYAHEIDYEFDEASVTIRRLEVSLPGPH